MPTIKDVALHAGVSRSTVSRVMNNHPYVDEEKRRAVRVAMTELGYIPNSSAQRLRGTETRTIAVLVSRIVNPFFSAIVDAMDEIAAAYSYRLILCNTRGSASQELHFLQLLRTKQVDGIILASIVNEWLLFRPLQNTVQLCYAMNILLVLKVLLLLQLIKNKQWLMRLHI